MYLYSEYISNLDDGKIKILCADGIGKLRNNITGETIEVSREKIEQAKKLYGFTDEDIQRVLNDPSKITKNYSLTFKFKTVGDWVTAFSYAFLVFVIGLATLELIKRTLRYIFMDISFLE